MKWFYAIALVVTVALVASPMLYLRGRESNPYAELEARLGRPVIVRYDSYESAIKSLDPATCGDVASSNIQSNVWEGLYTYHYLIRPPKVVPQLAAEMPEVSEDRLTYTIRLKPGVTYHRNPCFGRDPKHPSGWATRAVRAEDFVVAFKRIADYQGRADLSWTFLSDHVAGIDAFRERTRGLPDEVKAGLAAVQSWLAGGAGRKAVPDDLREHLKAVQAWHADWGKDLHVPEGTKDALAKLGKWAASAVADGRADPSAIAETFASLGAWRRSMQGYEQGDFSRYDLPVEGVKALDERTLQIKLSEPFPQFIYVLAMHVYAPAPREAMDYWFGTEDDGRGGRRPLPVEKKRSTEFAEAEQLVGTGPYRLTTFHRKHRIVLVRNLEFREQHYPSAPEGTEFDALTEEEKASVRQDIAAGLYRDAGKRVPFIDVLEYDFVHESYSAWMRFLYKRTDAAGIPKETFETVITPDKELAEQWRKKHIYLKKYSVPAIYWIVFNMEDPVLGASKSLRQALCLAFDRENYIRILLKGRALPADNIIPKTLKGHKEAGVGAYAHMDMARAQEKMREARKELAAAGLLVDGEIPQLKFEVGGESPAAVQQTDFVKQQFAKVGVRVKPVFNDWPTLQRKVRNKKAQMWTMGWHADYPDAENFLQLYYGPNIPKYTNNSNYSDPRFDALYDKARVMPDTPERTRLYAEMAKIIGEDCPVLLMDEHLTYVLYYEWMHNIKKHPVGYGYTRYVRIDTEMRRRLGGR